MEEINNDEIIDFLIEKYPSNSFEDKMERKMKKFEQKMEHSDYYTLKPINNNGSWCFSKVLMWMLIFLFVVFMAIMVCKK
jgi:hypothetical protein